MHICRNVLIVIETWIAHKLKNNSWLFVSRGFSKQALLESWVGMI